MKNTCPPKMAKSDAFFFFKAEKSADFAGKCSS